MDFCDKRTNTVSYGKNDKYERMEQNIFFLFEQNVLATRPLVVLTVSKAAEMWWAQERVRNERYDWTRIRMI